MLETLQRLSGSDADVSDGWFLPITIAKATGLNLDDICDEYDILTDNGMTALKPSPDRRRDGSFAKLQPHGAATLAESRKHRRTVARAHGDIEERSSSERLVIRSKSDDRAYDVFLSYASENRAYAMQLKQALNEANVSVWIDADQINVGDPIVSTIEKGIGTSRFAILLISPEYMSKPYPKAELDVLLKRQIESRGGFAVLPILIGHVTQSQLEHFSPVVARLRNLSTESPILALVREILRVVEPPPVTVFSAEDPHGAAPGSGQGTPTDALPDDIRLAAFRPRLNIAAFEYHQESPTEVMMRYTVANVGEGTASKISTFLPLLVSERLPGPLVAGKNLPRQVQLSKLRSYYEAVPVYARAVIEFEDPAGNLYRQYGTIQQATTIHGRYRYEVNELDRPYLVPQRIIPEESGGFDEVR